MSNTHFKAQILLVTSSKVTGLTMFEMVLKLAAKGVNLLLGEPVERIHMCCDLAGSARSRQHHVRYSQEKK